MILIIIMRGDYHAKQLTSNKGQATSEKESPGPGIL